MGGQKKTVENEFNLRFKGGDPRICENSIFPAYNNNNNNNNSNYYYYYYP